MTIALTQSLVAAATAWCGQTGPLGTAIISEPAAVDFGTVPRSAQRERFVRLVNCGSEPLRLPPPKTDCACLSSSASYPWLPVGGQAAVSIRLEACEALGQMQHRVWLGGAAPLRIQVRYRVAPEVYVEPAAAALGLVGDAPVQADLILHAMTAQPIELLGVVCDDPHLDVQWTCSHVRYGQSTRLAVRWQGPAPEGSIRTEAWIATTSTDVPRLRILVVGEVIGGLSADQREIVFEPVPLGATRSATLNLTALAAARVGDVRTSSDAIDATDVMRDANQTVITFTTHPGLPLGEFEGTTALDISGAQGSRVIRLPYRGRVTEPAALMANPHCIRGPR